MTNLKKLLRHVIILVLLQSCVHSSKNEIEIELDLIPQDVTIEQLINKKFIKFKVNWDQPEKWESNCAYYHVVSKIGSFDKKYYLDFCNGKYRWWSSTLVDN